MPEDFQKICVEIRAAYSDLTLKIDDLEKRLRNIEVELKNIERTLKGILSEKI